MAAGREEMARSMGVRQRYRLASAAPHLEVQAGQYVLFAFIDRLTMRLPPQLTAP